MSHYAHFHAEIEFPKDSPRPKSVRQSPLALRKTGLDMLVSVSVAGAVATKMQGSEMLRALPVFAHFDTGAYKTMIDSRIAKHLNLISAGISRSTTASNVIETPDYFIDIAFLNTHLKPVSNLQVGSCTLPSYDLQFKADSHSATQKGFGVLIGRDIMSIWNITWHGPTSTVLISD